MSGKIRGLLLLMLGTCILLMLSIPAVAAGATVTRPTLSAAPGLGIEFRVSGVTTPTARPGVATVVKVQVLSRTASGAYVVARTLKARLTRRSGAPGYRYTRSLTLKVVGRHAFRALRYANGRLVATSRTKYAEVTYGPQQLAHWTFDEAQGVVAADVAGSADGTLEGPPAWVPGIVRGALSFDGDDGVRCTTVAALRSQKVTYAAWVSPTAYPNAYNEILSFMRDDGGDRGAVILHVDAGGRPGVMFQNGLAHTVDITAANGLPLGQWSFLACSYDGARVRLFVNGVEKAHADFAGGIDYGSGPWQLHIGGDLYGWPGYFSGLIDEPAVIGRALR